MQPERAVGRVEGSSMSAWTSSAPKDLRSCMAEEVVERERARTLYIAESEGVVRMVRTTELPWLPEAPKTAMVDLDIVGVSMVVLIVSKSRYWLIVLRIQFNIRDDEACNWYT